MIQFARYFKVFTVGIIYLIFYTLIVNSVENRFFKFFFNWFDNIYRWVLYIFKLLNLISQKILSFVFEDKLFKLNLLNN